MEDNFISKLVTNCGPCSQGPQYTAKLLLGDRWVDILHFSIGETVKEKFGPELSQKLAEFVTEMVSKEVIRMSCET